MDKGQIPALDPIRRIILALDTDSLEQACRWIDRFQGQLELFKIGSELFTSAGPVAVQEVKRRGKGVFLDLKYHDIPNSVRGAVRAATGLGVTFLNVHALGGDVMIRSAVEASEEEAQRRGVTPPKVLAVTVLTSLDEPQLDALGLHGGVQSWVLRLAEMAVKAGAHGLVASPMEVGPLRRALGERIILVTPGIRAHGERRHDQKRVMGAREALEAGADYLVMGRTLLEARDPMAILGALSA